MRAVPTEDEAGMSKEQSATLYAGLELPLDVVLFGDSYLIEDATGKQVPWHQMRMLLRSFAASETAPSFNQWWGSCSDDFKAANKEESLKMAWYSARAALTSKADPEPPCRVGDAVGMLMKAAEGLYNGFEPDNQSALYREVDAFIRSIHPFECGPLATCSSVSATPCSRWIPVTERLPLAPFAVWCDPVLVRYDSGSHDVRGCIRYSDGGVSWRLPPGVTALVTHWMEIPT